MANHNNRRGSRDSADLPGGYRRDDGYYLDDGYYSDDVYYQDDAYHSDDPYGSDRAYRQDDDGARQAGRSASQHASRQRQSSSRNAGQHQALARTSGQRQADPRSASAQSRDARRGSTRGRTGASGGQSRGNQIQLAGDDSDRFSRRQAQGRYSSQRKKGSRKKTIIIAVICVILAVIGVGAAWAANYVHKINQSMVIDQSDSMYNALQPASENATAQDPFYMLLMGIDESAERDEEDIYGGAYRSDSIILARVDPQKQIVTLVSIHRDTVVDLSAYGGTGQDKINSAYVYGGRELMISTISAFAGVPISHYAEIDFDGFEAVVDALGGVDVNVEMTFYDPQLEEGLQGGEQTLNGEQALLYARARHAFDDYGDGDRYRAKHQREVLTAIAEKLLASSASTMANTISTLAQYIHTDMDVSTIVSIATSFAGVDANKCIYSAMEPTTSDYTDGTWYERVDTEAWQTMMQKVDAGQDPGEDDAIEDLSDTASSTTAATTSTSTTGTATVSVKNGSEYSGVAADAASTISSAGYTVTETGDADASDYASTLVIYSDSAYKADAEAIASALGVGTAMQSDGEYSFDTAILVVIGGDWNG